VTTCRRTAALTALVAALPLAAVGTVLLAEAGLILALANSQVAAPAGARWLFVIAVAICLGASLYLVGCGTYRAVRSWGSLVRFGTQSFATFGVSIVVLLIGFVFVVVATALGGGFF
jgi:cytochrome c-type biogenesis protein CcmH/NrfG